LSDQASTLKLPSRDLPRMNTSRVRLRPIAERDRSFLYELMTAPDAGGRVRFGGATPSPDKVASSLWESVLAQFLIESATAEEPLGLLAITSPNFREGFAYISALGMAEAQGTGLIAEGVLLGFHYAFSTWPFRKIYMEAGEDSYDAFQSGLGQFFVEEGRLRQHMYWNTRWRDVFILAVYRETWERLVPQMLGRIARSSGDS
jgi:RimJ/RimL family protein N-acetyltransferase